MLSSDVDKFSGKYLDWRWGLYCVHNRLRLQKQTMTIMMMMTTFVFIYLCNWIFNLNPCACVCMPYRINWLNIGSTIQCNKGF